MSLKVVLQIASQYWDEPKLHLAVARKLEYTVAV